MQSIGLNLSERILLYIKVVTMITLVGVLTLVLPSYHFGKIKYIL